MGRKYVVPDMNGRIGPRHDAFFRCVGDLPVAPGRGIDATSPGGISHFPLRAAAVPVARMAFFRRWIERPEGHGGAVTHRLINIDATGPCWWLLCLGDNHGSETSLADLPCVLKNASGSKLIRPSRNVPAGGGGNPLAFHNNVGKLDNAGSQFVKECRRS